MTSWEAALASNLHPCLGSTSLHSTELRKAVSTGSAETCTVHSQLLWNPVLGTVLLSSDVKEIRKKVKRCFLYLLKKHSGLVFQGRALAQDRDQDDSNLYVPKQVSRDCREKQTLQKPFAMQNSTNNCKLLELKQRNCLNGF